MEYTQLSENLKISKIITGLWQIADLEKDGKTVDLVECAREIELYIMMGYTSFDMADHYGSAELIIGNVNSEIKQDGQFFTKWVPTPGPSSKSDVKTALETAIERMKCKPIDLMQYHAWNYADPVWLDHMFWLQEFKEEGYINNLGVTNFDEAHLRMAITSGIEIISNQVSYSLLDQRALKMQELCKDHGIKILAFGTLAGGFLSNKWVNKPEPKNLTSWSLMKYKRFIDVAGGWDKFQDLLSLLSSLAEKHNSSVSNIATSVIMNQAHVGGIIIGAKLGVSEHRNENLKILNIKLSDEDCKLIEDQLRTFNPIPGDCGDEYRKPPFLTASGDLSHHIEKMPSPYPVTNKNKQSKIFSGTVWEDIAGFSRATIQDNQVFISGSTATHGEHAIGGNDPASQTHFIIDKIEGVLQSIGAELRNVVRTRIFIQNLEDWEPIARAHGERFMDIQPANTMVRADLIGDEYLVEIEVDAILDDIHHN